MSREELLQVGFNIPNKEPSVNADHDVADPTSHAQFKVKWLKGPPEPSKSDFGRFWAIWALFGRPWAKIGGTPKLPIGLKIPTYMSRNSFQLRSTPFQPFRTSRALTVRFWPFLGNLGPFWVNFGPWRSQKWSQKRALLGTRLRVPRQMRNKCLFTPNEKKISDPPPYPIVRTQMGYQTGLPWQVVGWVSYSFR